MRLKLDENLSRHLKQVFAGLGHDAKTAAEENLLSQPDSAVALAARTADSDRLTKSVSLVPCKRRCHQVIPNFYENSPDFHNFTPTRNGGAGREGNEG
jgi:hypothetical protein